MMMMMMMLLVRDEIVSSLDGHIWRVVMK